MMDDHPALTARLRRANPVPDPGPGGGGDPPESVLARRRPARVARAALAAFALLLPVAVVTALLAAGVGGGGDTGVAALPDDLRPRVERAIDRYGDVAGARAPIDPATVALAVRADPPQGTGAVWTARTEDGAHAVGLIAPSGDGISVSADPPAAPSVQVVGAGPFGGDGSTAAHGRVSPDVVAVTVSGPGGRTTDADVGGGAFLAVMPPGAPAPAAENVVGRTAGGRLVPAGDAGAVLAQPPYLGVACAVADVPACDRVGLAVWLRRPARSARATIGGSSIVLDDATWSGPARADGTRRMLAGFLEPAGLGGDGPLRLPGSGDRPWAGSPEVTVPILIEVTDADGARATVATTTRLSPGWG